MAGAALGVERGERGVELRADSASAASTSSRRTSAGGCTRFPASIFSGIAATISDQGFSDDAVRQRLRAGMLAGHQSGERRVHRRDVPADLRGRPAAVRRRALDRLRRRVASAA